MSDEPKVNEEQSDETAEASSTLEERQDNENIVAVSLAETDGKSETTVTESESTAPTEQKDIGESKETQPASTSATLAPKTYPARVLQIEDEPYDYDKSTLLVTIQIMPDDGHQDGREVALTINTHSDIPILKLVRMKELQPLPPWLEALLSEIKEAMPSYAEAAERRKEEEKAIRRAATTKSSSTSARNLKSSAGKNAKTPAGSTPPKPSDSTTAPVFEDQGSLFNLMTGQRPKSTTTAAAEGGQ